MTKKTAPTKKASPKKRKAGAKPARAPKAAATKAATSKHDARDERIVELEVRFTHQQALLDELSSVLFAQQSTIDRLEGRVRDLERRIADLGEPIHVEKPPHY